MSATSTPDPQANASGNSNSKEDLNEGQDDIVVLTPDAATLEKALAERAQKRLAIAERKRGEAGEKLAFGVTQMQEKNYDAAATAFGEACALWRANPVAHCDLATAYLHLGRFDDAESSASTALGLDPKLVEARYTRAMARKGRGSVRGAIVGELLTATAPFLLFLFLSPFHSISCVCGRRSRAYFIFTANGGTRTFWCAEAVAIPAFFVPRP
ncbi:hypothetical protein C8F04DRAFT_1121477 [Mycena alexandri]|uniref:Uncharacterized protein n=1 Tax=Mycena alexandri TaxID=1745969 RepID=A0AAD6SHF1_9AGAR|nr:hypothetical protein C8F04DRAFT_1121477 [Mycena alexandri]